MESTPFAYPQSLSFYSRYFSYYFLNLLDNGKAQV